MSCSMRLSRRGKLLGNVDRALSCSEYSSPFHLRASILQSMTAASAQISQGKKRSLSGDSHEQNGDRNRPQKSQRREFMADATDTTIDDSAERESYSQCS
jgi:hypothetical protein